jgi:predicted DNA-binding transcriptional regulator AlpA
MAATRLQDQLAYPPRAMRAERAAAYLGMSTSALFRLVADNVLPEPVKIRGMVLWDRLDLDAAFDNLKGGDHENGIERMLRLKDKK